MALSLTESSFAAAAENITSSLLFKNQRKSSPKPLLAMDFYARLSSGNLELEACDGLPHISAP